MELFLWKKLGKGIFALTLLFTFISGAKAQMAGEVRGIVKDASSGELLTAVSVQVEGLKLGSVTNVNGEFVIRRVPYGKYKVQARLVGYKSTTVDVTVGEVNQPITILMAVTAVTSDEIVVTGQGAAIPKKQLPYSVESISSEQINRPGITSVDQALQGQVPGLSSFNATGVPGTGARIQTRGVKSALSNTTPVIYVDGVRVDVADNFRLADGTGGATSSSLADLVTGDIERIEVIKGGAASALYGAEAANGVIQIFTKKGKAGDARIRFQHQSGADVPETKFVFEQRTKDLLYRTGYFNRNSLNVTGGNEALSYNASGSIQYGNGVFTENELSNQLYNVTGGIKAVLSSKSDLEFFANLTRNQFGRTLMGNAYDVSPLTFLEAGSELRPGNYVFPDPGSIDVTDPAAVERAFRPRMLIDYRTVTNRVISGLTFNTSPVAEWANRFTIGVDYRKSEERNFVPVASVIEQVFSVSEQARSDREFLTLTLEYAGSYKLPMLGEFLSQTLAFGARGFRIEDRESFINGQNFPIPGTTEVNNANTITAGESNRALFNGGFYLQDQIGIQDKIFINVAGRLDINTTFGTDQGIQFFPTVGLAYNISDESFFEPLKEIVTSLKLRGSWGKTGNFAPNPFSRDRSFVFGRYNATAGGLTFGNPGNRNLGPEFTTSIEYGFDLGIWEDRISVEFSYYDQKTTASLLNKPEDPAGGLADQVRNVGTITNNGIELAVKAIVLQEEDYTLSLRGSLTTVANRLTSLGGAAPFTIGGFAFLPMRAEEGQPLGVYRVTIPTDENGNRIDGPVPAGGFGQFLGDFETILFGTPTPTAFGSFGFDLTLFNDLTITALGEFATGHSILNQALDTRFYQGFNDIVGNEMGDYSAANSIANYNSGFLPNDNYVTDNFTKILVEKANWFKIREISARYKVPKDLIDGVNITLSVRNPFIFGTSARGIDPELATVRAGGALDLGGVGNLAVSAPRQFRFTIDWSF
ncbi:MAG: TonB-dependent receptor [Chloroherpetonaceae bacterium]|nr:TonB-dependent receptor [Chloroherpetonaceae bacterium]